MCYIHAICGILIDYSKCGKQNDDKNNYYFTSKSKTKTKSCCHYKTRKCILMKLFYDKHFNIKKIYNIISS